MDAIVGYEERISYISFEHDLGEDMSGYDCCKLLVGYDADYQILADDFEFNVHSANPVGKQNIIHYLNNWLKFKKGYGYEQHNTK